VNRDNASQLSLLHDLKPLIAPDAAPGATKPLLSRPVPAVAGDRNRPQGGAPHAVAGMGLVHPRSRGRRGLIPGPFRSLSPFARSLRLLDRRPLPPALLDAAALAAG
jgi:hypothetical protein